MNLFGPLLCLSSVSHTEPEERRRPTLSGYRREVDLGGKLWLSANSGVVMPGTSRKPPGLFIAYYSGGVNV